jgi:hypothetical protein
MFLVVPVTLDYMEEKSVRDVARLAAARRRQLEMDQSALARTANVDPKTVRAFERGERWPRERSRTRIEAALEWPAGSLTEIREGKKPFPMRVDREYLGMPPLTDEQKARMKDRLNHPYRPVAENPLPPLSTVRPFHGGVDGLRWLAEIQRKPEWERTDEERQWLAAGNVERDRLAGLAEQSEAEAPLVELVDFGRMLASRVNNEHLSAYVRKVEAVVVGITGIDRLTSALESMQMERTIVAATRAGIVEQLSNEIDSLREAGIGGRELQRRVDSWLAGALSPNDSESPDHGFGRHRDDLATEIDDADDGAQEGD